MKPQICCWETSKLTSRNAATPPKYLVRVFTSRIFTPSPEHPPQQSHETVGLEQNNKDQKRTVQKQMEIGEADHQLLFHNAKDHAAQNRAPHRADPADHRHQQYGNAGLKGE